MFLSCFMHFVLFLKIMFRIKIMPDPSSQETFFSTMGNTILHDDSTADFTIRCKTKVFRVHRNILCARSEVFRASIFTLWWRPQQGRSLSRISGRILWPLSSATSTRKNWSWGRTRTLWSSPEGGQIPPAWLYGSPHSPSPAEEGGISR